MRPLEEYREVMALVAEGHNDSEIARRTGIPRGTVRDWRRGVGRNPDRHGGAGACDGNCGFTDEMQEVAEAYAYLLGQYLGDGRIAMHARGVARLRISCTAAYPRIVDDVVDAIHTVVPDNAIGFTHPTGVTEVSTYWKHWICVFPQHGAGPKHLRKIELTDWQEEIRRAHPKRLLRGLIHSDGCRHLNTVVRPLRDGPKTYRYVRYTFTNASDDIRQIFTDTCDLLGIGWTRMNARNISVARRVDVAYLDTFVGPKA